MNANSAVFDGSRIRELFNELDDELQRRGVRGDLFVVGGAAMALAYSTRRATRDIAAVFEPKQVIYEAAAAVQANHADLDKGWLNDAVKIAMLGADPAATTVHSSVGLRVSVASPGYLFAMKTAAARVDRDKEDLTRLYEILGFATAEEVFTFLADTFPDVTLLPRSQYLIEDIASQASTGD